MAARSIVHAEQEHVRELTSLFNRNGGASVLKAAFGPFSSNALLETTHLTLVITEAVEEDRFSSVLKGDLVLGCMCISDSPKLSNSEVDAFESKIDDINELLPVTVRLNAT
jgi:hypothetical protein